MSADLAGFRTRVLSIVRRIPPGRVATYGDVAAAAGSPRAARAVGNIMRECRSAGVPCHRVIAANGRLGGFGGNTQLKRELLRAEGILVSGSRVKEFTARRWKRSPPGKRIRDEGDDGFRPSAADARHGLPRRSAERAKAGNAKHR